MLKRQAQVSMKAKCECDEGLMVLRYVAVFLYNTDYI